VLIGPSCWICDWDSSFRAGEVICSYVIPSILGLKGLEVTVTVGICSIGVGGFFESNTFFFGDLSWFKSPNSIWSIFDALFSSVS
jgi:hypothetical protein